MIDTHCHLDVAAFDHDRDSVLARAAAAGVAGVLVPAIRPRTWPALVALARAHRGATGRPDLRVALGVHPQIVPELAGDELPRDARGAVDASALADAIARAGADLGDLALAVGECGLDGGTADRDAQEQTLRAHVRAARALGRPLIVHVLRAHDAAPRILRDELAGEVGGVLHSYSGGADLVPVYAALGFAFSFAGPVTYPNARRPIAAVRAVPADRLLAETDAPDQAPAAHRGNRSEPAFVADVIAGLAAALDQPTDELRARTTANARRVLRWRDP
nr:TatD family hydrolase [Kofleriaceae bacterium]